MRSFPKLLSLALLAASLAACEKDKINLTPDAGADADGALDADTGPEGDGGLDGDACVPSCGDRKCGPNGCGGLCGTCDEPEQCDESTGTCGCEGESEKTLCAKDSLCGEHLLTDRCGDQRAVECSCPSGQYCHESQCHECVEESDAEFCERLGVICGRASALDTCLRPRVSQCDSCPGGWECASSGLCEKEETPTNALCIQPMALGALSNGRHEFLGSTHGALAADYGNCSPEPGWGAELYYSFSLEARSLLRIAAWGIGDVGRRMVPILYLRNDACSRAGQVGECSTSELRGDAPYSSLLERELEAGDYFLVVDSEEEMRSSFGLELFVAEPLRNERCEDAAILYPTRATPAVVSSTTEGFIDFIRPSCLPKTMASRGESVFQVVLPEGEGAASSVLLSARPIGEANTMSPVLYAFSDCATSDVPLVCGLWSAATQSAELYLSRLLPGTSFFVMVESTKEGKQQEMDGAFELSVALREPEVQPNDTCDNARHIEQSEFDWDVASGAAPEMAPLARFTTQVRTWDAANDSKPPCVPKVDGETSKEEAGAPDVYYSFEVPTHMALNVRLEPAGQFLPMLTLIKLQGTCGEVEARLASEASCAPERREGTVSLWEASLEPGTYLLIVDGEKGSEGVGQLTLEFWEAFGGRCPGELLDFAGGDVARSVAFTMGGAQNGRNSCSRETAGHTHSSNAFAFMVPVSGPHNATITVTNLAASDWYQPEMASLAISLRTSCVAGELECRSPASSAPTQFYTRVRGLIAGAKYYVLVEAEDESTSPFYARRRDGMYQLEVKLEPQSSEGVNDACDAAYPLRFDESGVAAVVADTTLGRADYRGGCSAGSSQAPDLVYEFELEQAGDLELTAASSDFLPVFYVRGDCVKAEEELGCRVATPSSPALELKGLQPAKKYYLFVDGATANDKGEAEITLTWKPSSPNPHPHDTCATASDVGQLIKGATILLQGESTTGAHDDYRGTCEDAGGLRSLHNGGDIVYSFTSVGNLFVTAKVTSLDAISYDDYEHYMPALYLRPLAACESSARNDNLGCAHQYRGNQEPPYYAPGIIVAYLPPGEYALIVDGLNATHGRFDLELAAADRDAIRNDTCQFPEELLFPPGTDRHLVEGDTTNAVNDARPAPKTCEYYTLTDHPDLVYAVDLSERSGLQRLVARMSVDVAGMGPLLYLRKSCDDPSNESQLACREIAWGLAFPVAELDLIVPSARYYLWVDGTGISGGKGPFSLEVEVKPPFPDTVADPCNDPSRRLSFVDGRAFYMGTTEHQQNAFDIECVSIATAGKVTRSGGQDVVHAFHLDVPSQVTAHVRNDPFTDGLPVVNFLQDCQARELIPGIKCYSWATGTAGPFTLPAGDHFLVVDWLYHTEKSELNAATVSRGYVLEVEALPDVVLPDSCAQAESIDLSQGKVTLKGSSIGARNDTAGFTCAQGSLGPDLVYTFDTGSLGPSTLKVTYEIASLTAKPALMLWKGRCADATAADELLCVQGSNALPNKLIKTLEPGLYYLWVDLVGGGYGSDFTLTVEAVADAPVTYTNTTCANAQVVDFGTETTVRLSGSNESQVGSSVAPFSVENGDGCTASAIGNDFKGAEAYYKLRFSSDTTLGISVTRAPESLPGQIYPTFYMYKGLDCSKQMIATVQTGATQVTCRPAVISHSDRFQYSTVTLSRNTDYHLVVDWSGLAGGQFELLLHKIAAPVTAAAPVQLALPAVGATASAKGTTERGVTDATCGGVSATYFEFFTPNERTDVTLTVQPLPGFEGVSSRIGIFEGPCQLGAGADLTCALPGSEGTTLLRRGLTAGTRHCIVVSSSTGAGQTGTRRAKGAFELVASLAAARTGAPSNDFCAAARDLGFVNGRLSVVRQTLSGALDDLSGACPAGGAAMTGPDLAYSFSLDAAYTVSIAAFSSDGMHLGLRLFKDCSGAQLHCALASEPGVKASLEGLQLQQGNYILWVDSREFVEGTFHLLITTAPPIPEEP